jgi:competence protein ComEC
VAISGLNITLLVSIFVMLLGALRVGRRASFVLSLLLAWFYAFMVGGEPPVVRAAWMSTVFLLAFVIERDQDMLNTVGFALLAMALADPRQLFDVGFQLSFICVLSIVLVSPMFLLPWVGTEGGSSLLRWLREGLIVSLAAWAGSAGITAYVFGNLTPVGLLANLPVVPLATLVTALGVGVVMTGSLFSPLGELVAGSLHIALNLLVAAAWFFSLVPGGVWALPQVSTGIVCGYYILFVAGLCFVRNRYVSTN